jgi:hypothetical protein
MYYYRVNGLTVGMPEAVTGLPAASPAIQHDSELVWLGRLEPRQMPSASDPGWVPVGSAGSRGKSEGSELWSRNSAGETWHLLRASGAHAAEFLVAPAGRRVEACWTNPALDRSYLVRLMLGPVLGLILRIRHRLPLHAGAVATGGRAIAVLGPSGSGKSTLIASLLDHECTLLSDDLIQVEENEGIPVLAPGQASLRLWPGSLEALDGRAGEFPRAFPYSAKRAVAVSAVSQSDEVPLAAICLLGPRSVTPVSLDRLRSCEALTLLLGQLYPPFLPVTAAEHGSLFMRLARLVARVPVYRICNGDGFAALPALSRRIIGMAAAPAG